MCKYAVRCAMAVVRVIVSVCELYMKMNNCVSSA